jgi:hypothetical protein
VQSLDSPYPRDPRLELARDESEVAAILFTVLEDQPARGAQAPIHIKCDLAHRQQI